MSERELFENGSLVRMRLSLSRAVFRPGPIWSVLAGAVTADALRLEAEAWLRLLTAVVLADFAWGAIRQIIPSHRVFEPATVQAAPPADAPAVGFLPYSQAGAPLARWLAALTPAPSQDVLQGTARSVSVSTGAWQGVLIVIALSFILSVLLGWPALILTAGALATICLASALARRGDQPALAYALLDIGWPWLLGISLAGDALTSDPWTVARPGLLLALAFTVLQWGVYHCQEAPGRSFVFAGRALAWCGQCCVIVALIVLGSPWAVGCVVTLLAAPSFWLARPVQSQGSGSRSGSGPLPWWWAASLVAALAVR